MQVTNLVNQLSTASIANGTKRVGRTSQAASTFNQTLQQKRINQVKQEIYDKFQISVGSYGKSFSCYMPSSLLQKMSVNPQLKEKVYEQLESYTPENLQASVAGLNPPVKKCTLIFDEGGDAAATLEAASSKQDLNSSANSLYQNYLLQRTSLLSYPSSLYSGYGLNSLYGLGGYPYSVSSLYGAGSLYNNSSLLSSVMSKLSQRI